MNRMARPVEVLELRPEERTELERRVRASTTSQRDSRRARIVLLRHEGLSQHVVAERVGVSSACVSRWSQRFGREGLAGLCDRPGRGRGASIPPETVEKVIAQAGQQPGGRSRWSTRSMAREVGIAPSTVSRIWRKNGLKPHRTKTFKLSKDKDFERKFWDVIGLYLDPPEKAVVLCCDEKTQCQALERTQPGLPLGVGHIRTRTHDHYRHGTVCLFAALSYLEGKLIYRTERKHTHVEWLRFLKQIHREIPKGPHRAYHCGQLQYPQACEGEGLAPAAQARPDAFHTDIEFLDESGRAVLRGPDGRLYSAGKFHECQGTN